jgi:hypothetical protein
METGPRRGLVVFVLALLVASVGGLVRGTRVLPRVAGVLGAAAPGVEAPVVELTNGGLVLGVLPPFGGRVVILRARDGENLLDSDPSGWLPPFPEASLDLPFRPWNGRIVWTGPQSAFWSQQDVQPERRASKAGWPPDPYNEAARFEVVERTPARLVLQGPVSPVTGLMLRHDYEITAARTVRMRVTATNGRQTPVSWDLWPNTRVRPGGHPYVPLDPGRPPRVELPAPGTGPVGPYPHAVHGEWLAMPPGHRPQAPHRRLSAKAFVEPPRGLVAFFHGAHLLLVRAPVVPPEGLHPEQAFVEVYRGAGETPADDILELEMHGAYETLPPGGTMSFEQTFEVLDYHGKPDVAGHLARLSRLAP